MTSQERQSVFELECYYNVDHIGKAIDIGEGLVYGGDHFERFYCILSMYFALYFALYFGSTSCL